MCVYRRSSCTYVSIILTYAETPAEFLSLSLSLGPVFLSDRENEVAYFLSGGRDESTFQLADRQRTIQKYFNRAAPRERQREREREVTAWQRE